MKRIEQRERTKAALLDAAAEEFEARGYIGTVLSTISDRLGLTKGSLYFYFPTKAELAAAVVASYFEAWEPLIRESRKEHRSGLAALIWLSYRVADQYRDNIRIRAAARLVRERELIDAPLPEPYVDWISNVQIFLREAQENGEVAADLPIESLAWQITATFFGNQQISNDLNNRQDLRQRVDDMWFFFLRALSPKNVPATPHVSATTIAAATAADSITPSTIIAATSDTTGA
ncbi:ScbR family autoregulator-binding transcription factor [Klugiella xanthotipulae]|uniref:TetR family transcriptional regulator n=1 Tax=Klugiella xanthotipulae TaxID=244735 RepID=A0A543I6E6_9MICO|nr:ScbR family autoregulator-binding transcription factor [Klugiella xanthotipulae]TQM66182.1 TetR family transcriptional regulator [Klugiella xanthotipulae]